MQLVFKEEPKVPNIRLLEKFGKSRWSDSMRVGLDIRAFEEITPRAVTAYDGDKFVGCAVIAEKPGAIEIVHINGVDEDVVAEIARHVVLSERSSSTALSVIILGKTARPLSGMKMHFGSKTGSNARRWCC